jgi:serine/threonine-protein kinase
MVSRTFLGRYQTIRLLGEGGMGRVYLARQTDLAGRQVVVKVMHDHIAADPRFCERFQREIHLMARFQHPYAVNLYDASGDDQPQKCIIMEYVKGITLENLLEQETPKRLHPARVGRILGQLCEVLQAAHNEGIIHRDLKPSNIMVVDASTPYEKIKVMDFGLAKLVRSQSITDANGDYAIGTPNYICPEQARGEEVDHRGDLYSVGVMLFELLTGQLPFTGGSTMDILLAHATESPPTFASLNASDWVPPAIEEVVQKCLAKDPVKRPKSARDLAEMYETALAHQQATQAVEVPDEDPRSALNAAAAASLHADPLAIERQIDAWMPERIAAFKLQGFVQDVGGEVVESVPGLIRVHLGGKGSVYQSRKGGLSALLGLTRRTGLIEMALHLTKTDPNRETLLHITVRMKSLDGDKPNDPDVKIRCDRIFVDLRAYLMGSQQNDH